MKVWARHSEQVDLLLTDMVMPGGLSGLELAQRLQDEKPRLKAIVTSGYSLEMTTPEGRERRTVSCLAKPYGHSALAMAVRECLDGA